MSVGRLFHTRGAATANARSPNILRVRGTYRSPLSAVHNEARDCRSATGLIRSAMYCGACKITECVVKFRLRPTDFPSSNNLLNLTSLPTVNIIPLKLLFFIFKTNLLMPSSPVFVFLTFLPPLKPLITAS